MNLAKVCGNIVSSHKSEGLCGKKLLLIQPVDSLKNKKGDPIIAVDSVGAGNNEYILYITSSEACIPFKTSVKYIPTDATIVGIVDSINLES
ncbi:MAG: EutN/CcmL family microcompartment protein [Candidatus Muiribacteriota bacterium]|jgi:ethanolamine utilization protein EutN